MRRYVPLAIAASLICLGLVSLAGAAAPLKSNPANDSRLLRKPIEASRYDDGTKCQRGVRRGTRALERWLDHHFHGVSWGSYRCERWGPGSFSIHAEGRALDWHLDAGVPAQRRNAMRLIELLLATDRRGEPTALARRMGVQGLIFNCKQWFAGMSGLDNYDYCYRRDGVRRRNLNRTEAHMDHVHIELNWPGARMRTSFWRWGRR